MGSVTLRGSLRVSSILAVLVILAWSGAASAANATSPGEFKIGPPTLKCLGFRWFIDGDDNRNASVTVTYRKIGEPEWKRALPMLRVSREVANREFAPYTCGNLFAGSIFNLEPDTEYEVHFVLKDPDGGSAEKTVKVKTRTVPKAYEEGRKLNVYPAGFRGKKERRAFDSIMAAYEEARPGDIILIHAGIYKGSYRLTKSGTEERPIVFRAAGGQTPGRMADGEAILDGENAEKMIDIHGTHHLFFEGLTIRNANNAFFAGNKGPGQGSIGLVVRRCHIYDVRMGFYSYSEYSRNWYIADNIITGRNETWYPRKGRASHTGVNIYGRGHIVCYNKVSKFWDCLAIANYGLPQDDPDLHCVSIDFYNNDLSEAVDDGIEADYGVANVRIFNNRITNCHRGLSTQPFYGGPCYLIRNHTYNAFGGLKLHNWPSGLEIYHNTCIAPGRAFRSDAIWQNAILRNNLFLGTAGYAMETGSPHPNTTLDYNGYRKAPDPEGRFIKWTTDAGPETHIRAGKAHKHYATLAEFYRGEGHEEHGVMVDFGIFQNAPEPVKGKTYDPDSIDLTLKLGCVAVDAGQVLPNVNDDYLGKAPDLGAYELDKPLPHYGPRAKEIR